MTELLETLAAWAEQLVRALGYPGIAALMFIENIFPPLPSELIMPLAGFLTSRDDMSVVGVIAAGTAGAVAGALVIYAIGMLVGERRTRAWFRRYGRFLLLSEDDYDRALHVFTRHGKIMVLLGRLMPGVRSLISLPAGLYRMNLLSFLFYTIIGTTIWNTVMTYAGVLLGRNWRLVLSFTDRYEIALWALLGTLVVIFIARRLYTRRRARQSSDDGQ